MFYFEIFNSKHKIFITLIFFVVSNLNLSSLFYLTNYYTKKNIIFTFWEPRREVPGYLQLCMKTWKKFLPNYEIKILDYKSVQEILGEKLFSSVVCKNMTLPIQADAIRVAILNNFGGIWMDPDIVILNGEFMENLKHYELAMVGDDNSKRQDIGFIYSSKNSSLLKDWLDEIILRVKKYKQIIFNTDISLNGSEEMKEVKIWHYLGNGIIDKFLRNTTGNMFYRIDRNTINSFPERKFYKNSSFNNIQKYRLFYFQKRDPKIVLNNSRDILYLHNSWTPIEYKKMSASKFIRQDILLSKLLASILNKKI